MVTLFSMASTCNTVGQTLGYFVSYVGFLALNDATTCRRFLPASLLPADSDKSGALLDLACFLRLVDVFFHPGCRPRHILRTCFLRACSHVFVSYSLALG